MVGFTEEDLLADISRKELDGIAKKLLELGDPEPIPVTITEQTQKVDDYTRRYVLTEDRERRLIRALVLFEIYARLASIPPKRQTKYDEAMRELRDIRDGKFPDIAERTELPPDLPSARGRWGGKEQINVGR